MDSGLFTTVGESLVADESMSNKTQFNFSSSVINGLHLSPSGENSDKTKKENSRYNLKDLDFTDKGTQGKV